MVVDSDSASKFPLNIDIGAKAEVKAEVPAASTGRLLDALTDLLRPFSEARGLRADAIRLQREDVLIEIAKKARKRMELESAELKPVPLRVMVPLLEKASLAEPSEEGLKEAWASLLCSASRDDSANHGIFIDVLSKLDPAHLRFLNTLMAHPRTEPFEDFFHRERHDVEDFMKDVVYKIGRKKATLETAEKVAERLSENALHFLTVNGCAMIAGGIHFRPKEADGPYFELASGIDLTAHPESVYDALEGLSLVRRHMIRQENRNVYIWISYCTITVFGFEFYEACT